MTTEEYTNVNVTINKSVTPNHLIISSPQSQWGDEILVEYDVIG